MDNEISHYVRNDRRIVISTERRRSDEKSRFLKSELFEMTATYY